MFININRAIKLIYHYDIIISSFIQYFYVNEGKVKA